MVYINKAKYNESFKVLQLKNQGYVVYFLYCK